MSRTMPAGGRIPASPSPSTHATPDRRIPASPDPGTHATPDGRR